VSVRVSAGAIAGGSNVSATLNGIVNPAAPGNGGAYVLTSFDTTDELDGAVVAGHVFVGAPIQIFIDGFESAPTVQRLLEILPPARDGQKHMPVFDPNRNAVVFLAREYPAAAASSDLRNAILWLQDTLATQDPAGDWNANGIPNAADPDPLGVQQALGFQLD
jgi:hypothetical protein